MDSRHPARLPRALTPARPSLAAFASATIPVGSSPWAIAFTPNGAKAYVTNSLDASVTVIDTVTNTRLTTIPLAPSGGPSALAVTPNGAKVLVVDSFTDQVSVISTATDSVVATLSADNVPTAIAIAPNGRAYVTNVLADNVTVIDTALDAVITTVGTAANPWNVSITPDGTRAYVVDRGADSVTVINTATNTPVTTIPTGGAGGYPNAVVMAPHNRAYVPDLVLNTVFVLDTATNTLVTALTAGTAPFGGAVAPNGRVYIPNLDSDDVTVIDSATDTVIATIPVGDNPDAVAAAPDGKVYVGNFNAGTVTVIDSTTDQVVATLPASAGPFSAAVAPSGFIYVVDAQADAVSVFPPYPVLTAVSPTQVPTAGRVFLTITGAHLTGAMVSVNGVPVAATVNLAGTELTLIAPPGNPGPATITVSTPGGTTTLTGAFSYVAAPIVVAVSPTQGPATGGTVLTITGVNLTGATVTVGGVPVAATVNPAGTLLTVVTPPGAPGATVITVTTPGGTATAGFTYQAIPTRLTATPALVELFPPQLTYPCLTATLTDAATGLPLPGQPVTFSTGGHVLGTALTDAHGTARLPELLTLPLIILNGGYTATFRGTSVLLPSTAHAGVITL